ncbi:MAG: sensor histidine kinase [Gammaproteobacteria bacterium]
MACSSARTSRSSRRNENRAEGPAGPGGADEPRGCRGDVRTAKESLRQSEERFRLLVEGVQDYAILMLDPEGRVATWNLGAERLKGYKAEEIIGKNFSVFYTPETVQAGHPQRELELAIQHGRYTEEGWRVRKDGTRFWADVTITALRDAQGNLRGFGKVTRDFTERKRAEHRVREHTAQLEAVNQELESFCYSVSHDLRAPLRAIDGFSMILQKTYGDKLDAQGYHYLERVCTATQRMGHLIDDLLNLSRTARSEMRMTAVNLSELACTIANDLQETASERKVTFSIAPEMVVHADASLMRVVLENLLGNAWKFSGKRAEARIEVGSTTDAGKTAYFVRDNGVGFDMKYADKLFGAFQRLHSVTAFDGTGVGLANVQRIILRHGGRVWAEAVVDQGATFYFTLLPRGSSYDKDHSARRGQSR